MSGQLISRLIAIGGGVAVGVFFGALIGIVLESQQAGMWIGVLFGVIMGLSILRMSQSRQDGKPRDDTKHRSGRAERQDRPEQHDGSNAVSGRKGS